MKQRGIQLGILHTSKAIGFYASLQWEAILLYTNVRPASYFLGSDSTTASSSSAYHFKQIGNLLGGEDEEAEKTRQTLGDLYEEYCLNFNGSFRRNHDNYWKDWVPCEFGKTSAKVILVLDEGDTPVGYLAYHWKEEGGREGSLVLVVLEFIVGSKEFKKDGGREVFVRLLKVLAGDKEGQEFKVNMREVVERAFKGLVEDEEKEKEVGKEVDKGWMFKVIDPALLEDGKHNLQELFGDKFLFWQADKF